MTASAPRPAPSEQPPPLVDDRIGGIFLGLCSLYWFGAGVVAVIAAVVLWWGTTIECNGDGLCRIAKAVMGIGAVVFTVFAPLLLATGAVTVTVAVRFARGRLVHRWIVVVPARLALATSTVTAVWMLAEAGLDAGLPLWGTVGFVLLVAPVACTRFRPAIVDRQVPVPGQPTRPPWITAPMPTSRSSEPGRPTS